MRSLRRFAGLHNSCGALAVSAPGRATSGVLHHLNPAGCTTTTTAAGSRCQLLQAHGRGPAWNSGFAARQLHTGVPTHGSSDQDLAADREALRLQAQQLHAATIQLRAVLAELEQLPAVKAVAGTEGVDSDAVSEEARALSRRGDRHVRVATWLGLVGLVGYLVAFTRLTFYELSWDVMEPLAFVGSQAWITVAYVYYMWTRKDYTYEDFEARIRSAVMRVARTARR